jgi:proline iminopeptidase
MRVTVDDVSLFYDTVGVDAAPGDGEATRPTIVALHGGPGFDHRSFRPALDALTDAARVVLLDFRGHGRSGGTLPDGDILPALASDVIRCCTVLGIEQPILWGESMGATVAIEIATTDPSFAGGLVIDAGAPHFDVDASVSAFERRGGAGPAEAARAFFTAPSDRTLRSYVQQCLPFYLAEPRPAPVEEFLMRLSPFRSAIFHWFGRELHEWDRRPLLSHVACPVVAAVGEHDCLFPPDVVADLSACPNARVLVVANAGHPVLADAPAELLAAARTLIGTTG